MTGLRGRVARALGRLLRPGLARRLAFSFSLLISVIILGLVVNNLRIQAQLVQGRLDQHIQHLLNLATEVSLPALLDGRPAKLDTIYEQWSAQDEIADIYLVDVEGFLMVDSGDSNLGRFLTRIDDPLITRAQTSRVQVRVETPSTIQLAQPIYVGQVYYGTIRLNLLREIWVNDLRKLWAGNLLLGAIVLAAGIVISITIALRVVEPLDDLTRATRRAAAGQLDQRISIRTGDELQSLATSFNAMLQALRRAMKATEAVAYRDRLTGTPNRNWLNMALDDMLVTAISEDRELAVLFLDLDWFKTVNDTYGHHAGDQLLVHFAERLRDCVSALGLRINDGSAVNTSYAARPGDDGAAQPSCLPSEGEQATIVRLGGDEFTIVVPASQAAPLCRLILKRMKSPFQLDRVAFRASTSIGIAIFPGHADNSEELLKQADVAMYQAKQAGRNTFRYYDEDHHDHLRKRQQLTTDLREGLALNQFHLLLQPQIALASRQVTGVELLLRWQHPERGLLEPARFLPIAADAGLMPEIGHKVVGMAFELSRHLARRIRTPMVIAMNLSGEEMADPALISHLVTRLSSKDTTPFTFELEISERTAMSGDSEVERHLERLRAAGYTLAIDDFGVGYSNLSRLKEMTFDRLKIDRSLLQGLGEDASAERLLASILRLATSLDKTVVAEGVETRAQLSFLAGQSCGHAQGFFLARPMTEQAFLTWMREQQAAPPPGTSDRNADWRLAPWVAIPRDNAPPLSSAMGKPLG